MGRVLVLLVVTSLFLLPSTVEAREAGAALCSGLHFVRASPSGQEVAITSWAFRNGNAADSVTIERLTVRNAFGTVVWQSGPATSTPHPLNTDFPLPGVDITTVPPGGSFYIATNHIWGLENIPGFDGAGQGNAMSALIEFSTEGEAALVVLGGSQRFRERLLIGGPPGTPVQGTEHSRTGVTCVDVK